jgi:hypothetical protein
MRLYQVDKLQNLSEKLTEINLEGPCQNIDVAVRELEI